MGAQPFPNHSGEREWERVMIYYRTNSDEMFIDPIKWSSVAETSVETNRYMLQAAAAAKMCAVIVLDR